MILTNCAACAAPLSHNAPRCVRCWTRYCDSTCQHDHWRRGHKQICKRIHRGGNAEQYNADKKYKEAVTEAVEACRGRHEGQKCYICLEAVHARTGEGLVRGCACGDREGVSSPELGVAHVTCLARQAKELLAEAEENNVDIEAKNERFERWHTCSLCEQEYHGVVKCALGWACWKTYVGRPEADWSRGMAMCTLGHGIFETGRVEEALLVFESDLARDMRLGAPESDILSTKGNIAVCCARLGRADRVLAIRREIYARRHAFESPVQSCIAANNLASSLNNAGLYAEAKTLMRDIIPEVRRTLGVEHDTTLCFRYSYARCLYQDPSASRNDVAEAVVILEDVQRRTQRIFGNGHPNWTPLPTSLVRAREKLASFDKGTK